MSNTPLSTIISAIVSRNAERKSRSKVEPPPESAKPLQPRKKKSPPPPKLSLAGISKSAPEVSAISERSSTPPTKGKKTLSKENFPLMNEFLKKFMKTHKGIGVFLGERMERFFLKLDKKFFQWLNHQKNSEKMTYEIEKEFMIIADALLLFEVMNEQRKKTSTGFIIGPFQEILTSFAEDETQEDSLVPTNFPEDCQIDLLDPMIQTYSKPILRKPLTLMNVCSSSLLKSDLPEILPTMPELDDTRCHIFEMEMELAGISDMSCISDMSDMKIDVSSFFK